MGVAGIEWVGLEGVGVGIGVGVEWVGLRNE